MWSRAAGRLVTAGSVHQEPGAQQRPVELAACQPRVVELVRDVLRCARGQQRLESRRWCDARHVERRDAADEDSSARWW
eukprot:scaffold30973_cov69-Phaeocystis_antarctica.AAC.4